MSRFYKFLALLFGALWIISFAYLLVIEFAYFELIKSSFGVVILRWTASTLGPSLLYAFILSLALITMIAMLLKKSIERAKGFSIRNIITVTILFFVVTTVVFFVDSLITIWTIRKYPIIYYQASTTFEMATVYIYPIVWVLLYFYLLWRFKLSGPAPDEPFEFEGK